VTQSWPTQSQSQSRNWCLPS